MAIDKLGIYNDALLLIGQRKLASLTEERESRRLLDSSWDLGAVDFCLEIVKPVFSRITTNLTSSTPSSSHDLDNVFTLPSDWVSTIDVYSDSRLDQPINRYINEDRTIACEYSSIFVRYVSNTNGEVYSKWSPAFTRVVSAYLAREIALRLSPEDLTDLDGTFADRVEAAIGIEAKKEPQQRSKPSTTTLSASWLRVYNDALGIMGLDEVVTDDDDSFRRSALDTAIDGSLVEFMLGDIAWNWAITSAKILQNPSLETDWGWKFSFDKPADLHRLDGVFFDEYFQRPLKTYIDEGDTFFSDVDEMYIKYVSTEHLTNPDGWDASFRKAIAGRLAKETCMKLAPDKYQVVKDEYEERYSNAKSKDAMESPPRLIAEGSWVRARNTGRVNRRRP